MPTVHARTCHICEANCGVLVEVEDRKILSIRGNPDHVLSRGHICPKATALADLQDDPDRLRKPVKRVGDSWQEIEWDQAYAEIGAQTAAIAAEGKRTALYVGNPTAHNYGVSTQLGDLVRALKVRGLYSASTLDQLPHQLIQMWMYGHNALFPIPDIDRTQMMLIVGGNPLASNGSVWTVPDVRNRIKELQARGEPCPDLNAVAVSNPLAAVEFAFPNYFLLPMFSSMSAYRIRPLGPESCIFELWSLTFFPKGEEPAPVMEPKMLPYDSDQFPPIPRQDYSNIPIQQKGMHAEGFEFMRLSKDIEGMISNYQRIIDGYLKGASADKLAKATHLLGGNFDGKIKDLGL